MPFLNLPPSHRSPSNSTASSVPTALLPAVDFAHHLDNYYPLSRPELGEKSANAWTTMRLVLRRGVGKSAARQGHGGGLLAVLLSPQSSAYARAGSQPYLSSLLSTHLQIHSSTSNCGASRRSTRQLQLLLPRRNRRRACQAGRWASSAGSVPPRLRPHPRWPPPTSTRAAAETHPVLHLPARRWIRARWSRRCCRLAGHCGTHKGTARARSKEMQPLLGASRPTSLDALAFSIVHTVLTLAATPQCQGDGASEPLRKLKLALDQSPWLVRWSRNVWKAHVKDLDLSLFRLAGHLDSFVRCSFIHHWRNGPTLANKQVRSCSVTVIF